MKNSAFVAICLMALASQQALATITIATYSSYLSCSSDPLLTLTAVANECGAGTSSGTSATIGCGTFTAYAGAGCTGASNTINVPSTCGEITTGVFASGGCETYDFGQVLTLATYGSGDCSGDATASIVLVDGTCNLGTKYLISGTTITVESYGLDLTCSGTATSNATVTLDADGNACQAGTGSSVGYSQVAAGSGATNPCFHEDTVINYQGEDLTFDQLKNHEQCNIPHVIRTEGVSIEANCASGPKTLRLTKGHLVYTSEGKKPASEVVEGTVVYADMAETEACEVVSNKAETSKQNYFGLNCFNSVVLADGVKTSTFEVMHEIPAMWMSAVGNMFGIQYASAIGEKLANVLVPFVQ